MAKLYCAMCKEEKEEDDFTKFSKNPSLKDREGRVVFCKDCCSKIVEEQGNTKEALKSVLRLVDIPYLENFANTALDSYNKKLKNTNLIIKKNIHDETEEVSGIETTNHQNTIYTCYSSKLGLMPKKYIDFSFSDGIRGTIEAEKKEEKSEDDENSKSIQSATRFLIKTFTKEIFEDKDRFIKAVEIKCQELSLHKNNTNARQNKHKLKNHILVLIEAGKFNKEDFPFLFGEDEENKPKDIMVVEVEQENKEVKLPNDMNADKLQERWGEGYKLQDLIKFEKKYLELRKNYEIKTASHDEFLKHACIASVRANECMAKNLVDEAKTWMGIFKDMTSAGKLQPSQMSKADLSGGLNNFSEFYKTVEEANGVIDVMPMFKKQPHDDPDFVIWCLIQYVRRLKGMPDCRYEDIWQFYEEMAEAFNDSNDKVEIVNDFQDEILEDEGEDDGE
jgi:hypothetical protein